MAGPPDTVAAMVTGSDDYLAPGAHPVLGWNGGGHEVGVRQWW